MITQRRGLFTRRRCLVPADAFYEWVRRVSRSDDCPAGPHDRTCRPIGSTLGGQAVRQRTVEKPSDNVTAAARLLSEPRGELRSASIEADRGKGGWHGQHMRTLMSIEKKEGAKDADRLRMQWARRLHSLRHGQTTLPV
jgi:hypothetical protein